MEFRREFLLHFRGSMHSTFRGFHTPLFKHPYKLRAHARGHHRRESSGGVGEKAYPVMRSSRTITLFSDRPDQFVSGSSFVVSILMHGAVIGVVALAILYGPQTRVVTERYAVRHLELHAPEPQARASAGSGIAYPGPHPKAKTPAPGGKQTAQAAALRQTAQGAPGEQTLVQPKIKNPVTLAKEIPIPRSEERR